MFDVIYLAAGQGIRAKLGYPKQFALLGGKPIMIHALEVFQRMGEIGRIIITCPPDVETVEGIISSYMSLDKIKLTVGGTTRQESVKFGLEHVETEFVLIHEAVRPFINEEFVRSVISVDNQAVTPWKPAISTVISADGRCHDRDRFGEVQMPQKYNTTLLKFAYEAAKDFAFTDDADLLNSVAFVKPEVIPGLEQNIKITTPLDLIIAEAIYKSRFENGE